MKRILSLLLCSTLVLALLAMSASAETEDETSASGTETWTPIAGAEGDPDASEAEPEAPLPDAEPEAPLPDADPEAPAPDAEPEAPASEEEADLPEDALAGEEALCQTTEDCTLPDGHEGDCVLPTAEDRLRRAAEGESIAIAEDGALSADLTIPQGVTVTLAGRWVIPEGVTLRNAGTLEMTGILDVYGALENLDTGVLVVAPDVERYPDAPYALCVLGSMRNAGEIQAHGAVLFEDGAALTEDSLPLLLYEGGSVVGSDRYVIAESEAEQPSGQWTAYADHLAAHPADGGRIVLNGNITFYEDVTISASQQLLITGGQVVIAPGVTVTNDGLVRVTEGALFVFETAALQNNCFVEVLYNGLLSVEQDGAYIGGEHSVLRLDQSLANTMADITGVEKAQIDCTVRARTLSDVEHLLKRVKYRFLTICVDDPAILDRSDLTLPENVGVAVR